MALLQAAILAAGAEGVRPGGVLVYSTCTISSAENERRIADFLDSRPDFSADDLGAELPSLRLSTPGAPAGSERFLMTLPHRDHTAGFFISRLRRS
jgi:16S rRNA (cytosine967-C5)-methyltransferase